MINYKVRSAKTPRMEKPVYYPVAVVSSPLTLQDVAEEIEKYCMLTVPDIIAVVTALESSIVSHLSKGHSVRLGYLGSFRPTIAAKQVRSSREEVKASDIKRVRCRFTPSVALKRTLSKDRLHFKRVATTKAEEDQD